jgi:hypothetical protein
MSGHELLTEFTTCLSPFARRSFSAMTATPDLIAAVERGWPMKRLADICSMNLPTSMRAASDLIVSRLEWCAEHDPHAPAQVRTRPAPANRRTCAHTDDPNGFLMDADGKLTGRCPCWGQP